MSATIMQNNDFRLLYDISTIVNSSMDIPVIFENLIVLLTTKMGVQKIIVTLFDTETRELSIIASYNVDEKAKKDVRYKLGEGITGTVAETGKAMIVPNITKEPLFLNKTKGRPNKKDISFICVPITYNNEILGTFGVNKLYSETVSLQNDLELLTVITSIIAQKIKNIETFEAEKNRLIYENSLLKKELVSTYQVHNIIGNSHAMKEVYDMILKVATSNATVLIRGETGTGKELVAHAIHYHSLRSSKPFIKINCSALPENLIESELFGHERGAFTGAFEQKKGRFELANGGTLFLDEIGELSPAIQIKLLRVLQEKEFERVGGSQTIKTDVRLISATNRNLEEALTGNQFRQDLYYRINVFTIFLPALRQRKSDMLLLADFFIEKYAKENHKKITRISTPAIDMLMSYHWPGNVRELENCIERSVVLSTDSVIHSHHLPPTLQMAPAKISATNLDDLPIKEAVENYEKELIVETLKLARGNVSKAAQLLKTTNRILGYKITTYHINARLYKA